MGYRAEKKTQRTPLNAIGFPQLSPSNNAPAIGVPVRIANEVMKYTTPMRTLSRRTINSICYRQEQGEVSHPSSFKSGDITVRVGGSKEKSDDTPISYRR